MEDLDDTKNATIGCCIILFFPFLIPLLILYGIYRLIKYLIKYLVENIKKQIAENKRKQKILDDILSKCKQKGIPEDIENLKNLVEQNIETNGSDIEFSELIFAIAKIYNAKAETEKAKEYFDKVKNIISHLKYEDVSSLAKKSIDNKNFLDAVFFYTCIILYKKVKESETPEIYYNRAMAYNGLNKSSYKKSAIEDLELAISKTNEISRKLSEIEAKSFHRVSKLDKYNYAIAEIYRGLHRYEEAIECYLKVLKKSNMYNEAQIQTIECYLKVSKKNYLKGEYKKALEYINYVIEYSPENKKYIEIKDKIKDKIKDSKKNKIMTKYVCSVCGYTVEGEAPEKCLFCGAVKEVFTVQKQQNNDILDYTAVNNDYNSTNVNIKIELETCSKSDLLTIAGFNEEKADRFIRERNDGKMYYDIEAFAADYALEPHQMIDIQDRLIFPPKPQSKIGRKVDW